MKVCFSGTFNVLHKGHKKLIEKAIETAGKNGIVYIGITDGEMLQKKQFLKPLNQRLEVIKKYLKAKGFDKQVVIKVIYDKYGPAIKENYDAIIVSDDTINNAEDINKKRIANGLNQLKIIKIPHVLAKDKKPISSTRVLKKEIDEEGRIL